MAGRVRVVAIVAMVLLAACTTASPDVVTERVALPAETAPVGSGPPDSGPPGSGPVDTGPVDTGTRPPASDEPQTTDDAIAPPETTTPPPPAPAGELDWAACEATGVSLLALECATLVVPLEHADPGGATIDVAVARTRATGGPAERIGSLVINPGGPGGSGIEALGTIGFLMSDDITRRFDLVGFDPRGVGASTALACDADRDDDVPFVPDDDKAAWDAVAAATAARLATCTADTVALARHVGTNNAARDMDLLRAALGDDRLTYLGYSYGTRLGAAYAELFPQRVRALVLDGGVKPDPSSAELDREQGLGFDLAIENFAAACDRDADCPLRPVGPALDVIRTLTDEVAATGEFPTRLDGRVLTAGELQLGIAAALYNKESWPYLAAALADAATADDGTLLQVLGDALIGRRPDGSYDNSSIALTFINCADDPVRVSASEQWTLADAAADESEHFGEFLRGSTGCLGVDPSVDPLVVGPAVGAPPIVVIGTTGDPATPYEWSVELAELLESGVLYRVEAEGHTSYGTVECVRAAIDAYLIDLTVPTDRSCADTTSDDFFPPPGESDLDQILSFFDCLRDNGADLPPIDAADVLADPSLETLLELFDVGSASFQLALLACADQLPDA